MSTLKSNTQNVASEPKAKKPEAIRKSEKELKKQAKASFEKEQAAKSGKGEQTAKPKPPQKEELKDKNLAAAAKESEERKRTVKYKYPEGATSKQEKEFRRKARATKESFLETLAKLKESNEKADKAKLKETEEKYAAFLQDTYLANPEQN